MYAPARDDEITGLARYVDEQLAAIRAAAVGLTEDQARLCPCRSALSIGGLVKHATYCMRGAIARLTGQDTGADHAFDEAAVDDYQWSLALRDHETAAEILAEFDDVRATYLAVFGSTDPGTETMEPPAPWHGIFDARPANARFLLVHHVEEFARHAGHADIIREQIDGMAVPAIVMSQEGAPANEYFQPYVPASGTIGA